MLKLSIIVAENYDEGNQKFHTETFELELEHSLASLSKWEQKFEKPFLDDKPKSTEEVHGYIEAMLLTPNVPVGLIEKFTKEQYDAVNSYINAKMTATTFREIPGSKGKRVIITNELIYYWMFSLGIPLECENWHLARLFTLIRVFDAKNNTKPSAMSSRAAAEQRRALNRQRRAETGSRG